MAANLSSSLVVISAFLEQRLAQAFVSVTGNSDELIYARPPSSPTRHEFAEIAASAAPDVVLPESLDGPVKAPFTPDRTRSLINLGQQSSEKFRAPYDKSAELLIHTLSSPKRFPATPPLTPEVDGLFLNKIDPKEVLLNLGKGASFTNKQLNLGHLGFEQIAREHPDWKAIEFKDEHATYSELNRLASNVASVLQHRGISRGQYVAVISHSSIDMVAGILGTLKAGAAFIPVDSSIPESRIQFILENAKCQIALFGESFDASCLQNGLDLDFLDLRATLQDRSRPFYPPVIRNEDPSYAIFTRYARNLP